MVQEVYVIVILIRLYGLVMKEPQQVQLPYQQQVELQQPLNAQLRIELLIKNFQLVEQVIEVNVSLRVQQIIVTIQL